MKPRISVSRSLFAMCVVLLNSGCPSFFSPTMPPPSNPADGLVAGPKASDGSGPAYYTGRYSFWLPASDLRLLEKLSIVGPMELDVQGTATSDTLSIDLEIRVPADSPQAAANTYTQSLLQKSVFGVNAMTIQVPGQLCARGNEVVSEACPVILRVHVPKTVPLSYGLAWGGSARIRAISSNLVTLVAPEQGFLRAYGVSGDIEIQGGGPGFSAIFHDVGPLMGFPLSAGSFTSRLGAWNTLVLSKIGGKVRVLPTAGGEVPYFSLDGALIDRLPFEKP